MKITLIVVGKTMSPEIKAITADYARRISHYVKLEELLIDNSSQKISVGDKIRNYEGGLLLKKITPDDYVILLDDKGKELGSVQFAKYLENIFNRSLKNICFIVGGAYGFSEDVYRRANAKISLSKLTFPHQLVRAIFLEQLYRAFTIMNNEKYHHE